MPSCSFRGADGEDLFYRFVPPADGTYYLFVEHYSASARSGDYELLAVELNPTPPLPTPDDHGDDDDQQILVRDLHSPIQGPEPPSIRAGSAERPGALPWPCRR